MFSAFNYSESLISSLNFNTSAINYLRPRKEAVEDRRCFHQLSCQRSLSNIMITICQGKTFCCVTDECTHTIRVLNGSDFDWDWLKILNEPTVQNFRTFKSSRFFFPAKNHTRSPQKRGQSSLANHLTSYICFQHKLPHVCCASMKGVLQHRLTFGQSDVHPTCRRDVHLVGFSHKTRVGPTQVFGFRVGF